MERTKKSNRIVEVADDVIRLSPFAISRKRELAINGDDKQIYRGKNSVVVRYGQLYEEDRGTLICLLEMAKKHGDQHQAFDFILKDIAKLKGVKNPWQKTTTEPIWESIDRLLDASIRIRPTKEKGLTARFNFIEGWLDSDGSGRLSVGQFLDVIRDFALGTTNIDPDIYFKVKSPIARSLYAYLSSQELFYNKGHYQIRLGKFTKYINYDTEGKPWSEIRPYFKHAAEELKRIEFLNEYRHDKNRCKSEGGVMEFWSAKKKLKELSTGEQNQEIVQLIKDEFPEMEWTEVDETHLRTTLNKTTKFLEQYSCSLKDFVKDYCEWLKNKKVVKRISPALFDQRNTFFQEYVSQQRKDGHLPTKEEYEKEHPSPEAQQENKKQEEAFRKQMEKRSEEERKKMQCPYGHQIGKDYDKFSDCFDCISEHEECERRSQE